LPSLIIGNAGRVKNFSYHDQLEHWYFKLVGSLMNWAERAARGR
jgi:hypothetical protein